MPQIPGPASSESRRTVLRVIVISQLVLALVTGVSVAVLYNRLDRNLSTLPSVPEGVERPDEPSASGASGPLNILVIGSDDRSGANAIDEEAGSLGADMTMLLHVSGDRKDAYGISLPRDAMVARPECVRDDGPAQPARSPAMFNEALTVGGASCMVQMVESLTDVRIHHTVLVDFNGFVDMVDAVGGVEVCIPTEVNDPEHDIFLSAGTQVLKGDLALDYVRERYQLSVTGDLGRMKRNQAFIASLINKVFSSGTLTRPDQLYGFLSAATASLHLDEGLASLSSLVSLALEFRETGLDDIRFITVPIEDYPPNPNRLQWAPDAADLWDRIRHDRPLGARFESDSISAQRPPGRREPTPGDTAHPSRESNPAQGSSRATGLCDG
ncbi:LCP family protein [Nocardioides gilvus]|uniref:LCP family protein n=1 Tax=Nocardioides gilvus TaxID=1735589 RepID=UPI000D743BE3|nr:LCP family protein [Nocardioides gilvus]